MTSKPDYKDPAYWEAWAADLGWDADKARQAGEVGALAVSRGLAPDDATDIVLARVRDGKNVRIGPGPVGRLMQNEGCLPFALGVLLFLAAGVADRSDVSAVAVVPMGFAFGVAAEFFLIIWGLTRRRWRLSLLGLALTGAALVVAYSPETYALR